MNAMPRRLVILRRESGGVGGAEKAAARMSRMFGADWAVSLLCAGLGVDGGRRGPGWFKALSFARAADAAVRTSRPDLVFSMERGPLADIYRAGDGVHRRWLEIAYAGKLSRWTNPLHHVYPALERRTLTSVHAIVANSEMVARDMRRFYPEFADKVRVIRNGFDPEVFSPGTESPTAVRARIGLPADGPLFIFVGSGWARKGLPRSLRLLGELARLLPNSRRPRLVVLGKGDPASLADDLRETGLEDRVEFRGPVSDVARFLRAADAMILPTSYDPFSNATLEALACGCPVVTTDTNGAAEAVRDGDTGIILPGGEENAARDARRLRDFLAGARSGRDAVASSVKGFALEREQAEYRELFAAVLAARNNAAR